MDSEGGIHRDQTVNWTIGCAGERVGLQLGGQKYTGVKKVRGSVRVAGNGNEDDG